MFCFVKYHYLLYEVIITLPFLSSAIVNSKWLELAKEQINHYTKYRLSGQFSTLYTPFCLDKWLRMGFTVCVIFQKDSAFPIVCSFISDVKKGTIYIYIDFTLTGLLVWVDFINVQIRDKLQTSQESHYREHLHRKTAASVINKYPSAKLKQVEQCKIKALKHSGALFDLTILIPFISTLHQICNCSAPIRHSEVLNYC